MTGNLLLFDLLTNNVLFTKPLNSTSLQAQATFSNATVFSLFVSVSDANLITDKGSCTVHSELNMTASIRQENGK